MKYDVADIQLASEGKKLIEWASRDMPVLKLIRKRFESEKPLNGVTLAACLHVTSETANLMITLKAAGADVFLCASNPLSTNDAVAASLVSNYQIPTFAIKGEDNKTYYKHLNYVLDHKPNLTMDDGADLVGLIHSSRKELLKSVVGSSEETTTGVIRLRAMSKDKALKIPVLAVNDNETKHLFDNRYGTGQSTIDGILRATNMLLAGRTFVVCEVNPIKALEAKMDGFAVMPLSQAIKKADVVLTSTGNKHVIDERHFKVAKDGVILAQAGHFDVEINIPKLSKMAKKTSRLRPFVDEFNLGNKKIYLLAEGRLVNLAAAEGHPASVMDMSFAGQALAAEYLWKNRGKLKNKVYSLPSKIDWLIASLKLKAEKVSIDRLTKEQRKYLSSWIEGT